jgi:hypothetical protein
MAANETDKFQKKGASTVTPLAAPGKALSATSITVGSTTNWPTDTGITFAIRVVDSAGELVAGTYTEWVGTVTSGTTIAMNATPVYGSDQVYAAGSTTQVFIPLSSSSHNKMVDGLLTEHRQDGTHDIAQIVDDNGLEKLKFTETASAVNEFTIANAATGNGPTLSATGGDTNIDVNITPKGTGEVTKAGNPIDWWEELGRTTLGSAGDTITVSSLPNRKYIKILYSIIPTGGVDTYITFNNDGSANYSQNTSATFAAPIAVTSATAISIDSGVPSTYFKGVGDVVNISTINKLLHAVTVQTSTAGAATAPTSLEIMGKWVNTSDSISRIDLVNTGAGSFNTGSELVVLGHN